MSIKVEFQKCRLCADSSFLCAPCVHNEQTITALAIELTKLQSEKNEKDQQWAERGACSWLYKELEDAFDRLTGPYCCYHQFGPNALDFDASCKQCQLDAIHSQIRDMIEKAKTIVGGL